MNAIKIVAAIVIFAVYFLAARLSCELYNGKTKSSSNAFKVFQKYKKEIYIICMILSIFLAFLMVVIVK